MVGDEIGIVIRVPSQRIRSTLFFSSSLSTASMFEEIGRKLRIDLKTITIYDSEYNIIAPVKSRTLTQSRLVDGIELKVLVHQASTCSASKAISRFRRVGLVIIYLLRISREYFKKTSKRLWIPVQTVPDLTQENVGISKARPFLLSKTAATLCPLRPKTPKKKETVRVISTAPILASCASICSVLECPPEKRSSQQKDSIVSWLLSIGFRLPHTTLEEASHRHFISLLLNEVHVAHYETEFKIFKNGDKASDFYIVLGGKVDVMEGIKKIMSIPSKSLLGTVCLENLEATTVRYHTAVAKSKVSLIVFPKESLFRINALSFVHMRTSSNVITSKVILEHFPILQQLRKDRLGHLCASLEVHKMDTRQILLQVDQPVDALIFITSGSLQCIYAHALEDETPHMTIIEAPLVLGMESFNDKKPLPSTVQLRVSLNVCTYYTLPLNEAIHALLSTCSIYEKLFEKWKTIFERSIRRGSVDLPSAIPVPRSMARRGALINRSLSTGVQLSISKTNRRENARVAKFKRIETEGATEFEFSDVEDGYSTDSDELNIDESKFDINVTLGFPVLKQTFDEPSLKKTNKGTRVRREPRKPSARSRRC